MKITEAVWEKRNLGVDTIEVTFENKDGLDEIEKQIEILDKEYVVLRIPSDRPDILWFMEKCNYRYVEDIVELVSYLRPVSQSSVQKRVYDSIAVEQMNVQDIEALLCEVKQGMFATDRISLDDFFKPEQAKQRYANWIQDEMAGKTEFLKYTYKGNTIAFFTLKELEEGYYDVPLGGFYKQYRNSGMGAIVKVPEEVKKRGGKKVRTNVSTNNLPQIRNLIINGYIPESISHIFIKHC
ncbi:MAG: hypothetical protein HFH41_00785 [Lachnospiraceae bacterium]|nr:hypothetical protein [Lachnospiraceae bacterium]